jgi:hypothetical protein
VAVFGSFETGLGGFESRISEIGQDSRLEISDGADRRLKNGLIHGFIVKNTV